MTNHEKWRLYFSDNKEIAQNIVDIGFYFVCGAALERRVWIGDAYNRLFANPYVGIVGVPGCGKSLVAKAIDGLLENQWRESSKPMASAIGLTSEGFSSNKNGLAGAAKAKRTPLFQMGANTTSYASMVDSLQASQVSISVPDPTCPTYSYMNATFVLDEIKGLLDYQDNDLNTFLLQAYDARSRYKKANRTSGGEQELTNICVSIFGGTQPDVFAELLRSQVTDGFVSRLWIVSDPRPSIPYGSGKFFIPDKTVEQIKAYGELRYHVAKLGQLYGRVAVSPAGAEFLEMWYKSGVAQVNKHPILKDYYVRHRQHVQKMIMAFHFADHDNMRDAISVDTIKRAIDYLGHIERDMHLPFIHGGANKLIKLAKAIQTQSEIAGENPITFEEICQAHLHSAVDGTVSIWKAITDLISSGVLMEINPDKEIKQNPKCSFVNNRALQERIKKQMLARATQSGKPAATASVVQ